MQIKGGKAEGKIEHRKATELGTEAQEGNSAEQRAVRERAGNGAESRAKRGAMLIDESRSKRLRHGVERGTSS